jgi:hypothetical protein
MRTPEPTRQLLGCGFAPLPAGHLLKFVRAPRPAGYEGDDPTVCPGYTTSLPEVIEIARARFHWKNGGPAAIGITDWVNHPLAIGIEILEGAANESERWSFDNPVKK